MLVRHIALAVAILAVSASAIDKAQQNPSQTPTTTAPATTPEATTEIAKMRDGFSAFNNKDYAHALTIFREVANAHPENVQAHNMVGNCAMQLKDYVGAATSFNRALQLMPDEEHNLNGIMRAYTFAGMTTERESERAHIRQIEREGRLSKDFCYMIDAYSSGERRIEAFECPEFAGRFKTRYWFYVYNAQEQQVLRIALESNDMDQVIWAKDHPREAAAGQREFSLDGYRQNTHSLYRFYDGEPAYEQVRADIAKILAGESKPQAATTLTFAPAGDQKPQGANSAAPEKHE